MALHHCLLAEDEALIGMALQDILEDAGIAVAGPFTTSAEALASSRQRAPSVAVLDFALKDGPCTELATHLMAQGVPVIVCSGWPRDSEERAELSKVTWLEKPFGRVEFLKTISALAPVLTPQLQTNL